ncbi:MAG TPA: hypothetical protein VFM46_00215, partial [Pseudomonadales bacterium]|nr:hypothetical protein [Pseudomonadales bacterium]
RSVSEQHKCGLTVLRKVLRGMVQLGIAHVSGWDQTVRGTPAAIFAGGVGENSAPPKTREGLETKSIWGKGIRIRPSANLILFADLIRGLDEGGTIAELTKRTGGNPATVGRFVNYAKAIGLAHIGAWDHPHSGYPARVFMLGAKRNMPRPKALTPNEKALRQYHARQAKKRQIDIVMALTASSTFMEAA